MSSCDCADRAASFRLDNKLAEESGLGYKDVGLLTADEGSEGALIIVVNLVRSYFSRPQDLNVPDA